MGELTKQRVSELAKEFAVSKERIAKEVAAIEYAVEKLGWCPACAGKPKKEPFQGKIGIQECSRCGGIYGQCYLGDSYAIVKPYFEAEEIPAGEAKYFDFKCVGSKGLTRRHGWYNPKTGLITQVG